MCAWIGNTWHEDALWVEGQLAETVWCFGSGVFQPDSLPCHKAKMVPGTFWGQCPLGLQLVHKPGAWRPSWQRRNICLLNCFFPFGVMGKVRVAKGRSTPGWFTSSSQDPMWAVVGGCFFLCWALNEEPYASMPSTPTEWAATHILLETKRT